MARLKFSKWTNDSTCKKIMNKDYKKYMSQFTKKEQKIIRTLLLNLDFFDNQKCQSLFEKYAHYLERLAIKYPDSIFFLPINDNEPHNSTHMFSNLKKLSKKYKGRFQGNYLIRGESEYLFNVVNTIIIIDDFSGSGKSIVDMLKDVNEKANFKKKVIVSPMLITDFSKENIEKEKVNFSNLDISFELDNDIRQAKVLSSKLLLDSSQIQLYDITCNSLNVVSKYGYEDTEELIAFSYYTPNNTLGLLWEPSEYILPFLKRDNNNFVVMNNNLYFSHDKIELLKKMIINEYNYKNRRKSILSIFLLLGFDKEYIWTHLKIRNEEEYANLIEKCINDKIIKPFCGIYKKGDKFNNFVDDEIFTRLVCLNQNITRKQKIDEQFASVTE